MLKALTFTEGEMQVKAKGRTPADGLLLLLTAMDKCYETEVEVRLGNGNIGGLVGGGSSSLKVKHEISPLDGF